MSGPGPELTVTAVLLFAIYLFPGIIAELRRHRNRNAIVVLNLLLGWTVLGWIAALVWASTNDVEVSAMTYNSWGFPRRRRAPRDDNVRERWTGDRWTETRVLERNGSLCYVEDTDGRSTPGWVGEEELR